jgi:hypothetical protein
VRGSAIVFPALVAASLAACAGPAPGSGARTAYGQRSQDAGPQPSSNDTTRQARLTSPSAKPSLETLPGMMGSDLTTLIGAPQFRRRDGQAEIWQYRGSACTLDVFLYVDGNDLRVRYVEARGHAAARSAAESSEARACAASLLESRAGNAG